MTPTPLTVSIDNVVLTEEQVDRAVQQLAERKRQATLPKLIVTHPRMGTPYLNMAPHVAQAIAAVTKDYPTAYAVLFADGRVSYNPPSSLQSSEESVLAGFRGAGR